MKSRSHWVQLDGIRAVAIVAVIAYHLGDLPGGWIGVDIFFVLSGYLITTILLADRDPRVRLKRFWGRRARRLLPAVLTLLIVLSVYAWASGPGLVPAQMRSPALATLLYVPNWQQISAGHSYFAQYTAASPLQHTWSLAVEEQYYLLWPLLLGGLIYVTRTRWPRRGLIVCTMSLAVVSAVWMSISAHVFGPDRAYLGTDTRAWELLLGGAAAMLWPLGATEMSSRTWSWLVAAGAAGVVVGASAAGGPPGWVWDGGLVAIAVCAGLLVVGSVRAPGSPIAVFLSVGPMRWLGRISYSLYLWHWPVIVLMSGDNTGLSGLPLLGARLAAMLAVSCVSYYLVERPLRLADWGALSRPCRMPTASFASVGILAAAVLILGGTVTRSRAPSGLVAIPSSSAARMSEEMDGLDVEAASPGHPYRVWILGDSVMADASPGITAALRATGDVSIVANTAFPGWGLSTNRAWPQVFKQVIADDHPQIVMGTWSWDDDEAAQSPKLYLQGLEAAMRALLTPGDGVEAVVLLQFPQTGPPANTTGSPASIATWAKRTLTQDAWDQDAREATMAFPGHAIYVTTSDLFAPDGRFYTWLRTTGGTWIRARKMDNTHFCPFGAAEFGALIVDDFTAKLRLPQMRQGWEFGAWTRDPRFNQPPGACPADQLPPGYHGIPVPATGGNG
jgi:peptidoglycan/LPS O-acetylase OafA/YrhL